ncbi:MAG TPA: type II secretion system major pseudopilin GspG [Solimonas sp.]|nr:type II secretion system major pseudopilin GspG [Solimonas sp.]
MKNLPRRPAQSGFTLIEIMVVVVILGILASIIVPKIMKQPDEARIVKAKQDIRSLESALNMYRLDNFYYPTTQQGLEALVTQPSGDPPAKNWKGYVDARALKDPWGNPYSYLQPGTHGEFDVFSLGADNQPGGEGAAADIGNWALGG